jgi:hypothetical protein
MKDPASSRFSAARFVLIALPLLAAILWQEGQLGRLRAEHSALLTRASMQGLDPSGNPLPSGKSGNPRLDPLAEARDLAQVLIRRAGSEDRNHTDWEVQIPLVERLQALRPSQLEEVIRLLLDAGDMPPDARFNLLFHLLDRLGEDRPERALELAEEMETRRPDHHVQYRIDSEISSHACSLAEKDPEAAWAWFLEKRSGWDERRIRDARGSLLIGISRIDPAQALRKSDEEGHDGIEFLHYSYLREQKIANISALRVWSRGDEDRRSEMLAYIRQQTFPLYNHEPNRFDNVIPWIGEARLTDDEIGFIIDPQLCDLGPRIDQQETGKWIDWLNRRFAQEEVTGQIDRLFKNPRTGPAARSWLDSLQPAEAAEFTKRYRLE